MLTVDIQHVRSFVEVNFFSLPFHARMRIKEIENVVSYLNHCDNKARCDLWDGALCYKSGRRAVLWIYPEIIINDQKLTRRTQN